MPIEEQRSIEQLFDEAAAYYDQRGAGSIDKDTGISEKDADSFVEYNVALTDDEATMRKERAQNQTWGEQAMHGLERFGRKTLLTAAQQMSSLSELGSHFTDEGMDVSEAGNSFYNYLDEWKKEIDEDTQIFQVNEGESFDFGDSAWWISNISSGAESAAAFLINSALTGQMLGAAFGMAAKVASMGRVGQGMAAFNRAKQLISASKQFKDVNEATKAMKAFDLAAKVMRGGAQTEKVQGVVSGLSQLGTAAIGNHMEGFGVALETAKQAREKALADGKSTEEADKLAASAAATAYNWNMANIALNISGAGAFVNGAKGTRKLLQERSLRNSMKSLLGEGVQEGVEEGVNFAAEKAGMMKAEGKTYSIADALVDTLGSSEGRESMFWGSLMGMAQTGGSKAFEYAPITKDEDGNRRSKANIEKERYLKQQEIIEQNKKWAKENGLDPDAYMNSAATSEKLTKAYESMQEAINEGDEQKKELHRYQALAASAHHNFENGTTESFIEAMEGERKRVTQDKELTEDQKKASIDEINKAISLTLKLEDEYNAATGYHNKEQVYLNKSNQIVLGEIYKKSQEELAPLDAEATNKKLALDVAKLNLETKQAEAIAGLDSVSFMGKEATGTTVETTVEGIDVDTSKTDTSKQVPIFVEVDPKTGKVNLEDYSIEDRANIGFPQAVKDAEAQAVKASDEKNFPEEAKAVKDAQKEYDTAKNLYQAKEQELKHNELGDFIDSLKDEETMLKSLQTQSYIIDKMKKDRRERAERKHQQDIENAKAESEKKRVNETKASDVTGAGESNIETETEEDKEQKRVNFLKANEKAIPPTSFNGKGVITNAVHGKSPAKIKEYGKKKDVQGDINNLMSKYNITRDQASAFLIYQIQQQLQGMLIQNNLEYAGDIEFSDGEIRGGVYTMDNKLAIRFVNEDGTVNGDMDTDIYKLKKNDKVELNYTKFEGNPAIQVIINDKPMGYMHTPETLMEYIRDGKVQDNVRSYAAQINNLNDIWAAAQYASEQGLPNITTTIDGIYDGTIEQHKKKQNDPDVFDTVENSFGEGQFVIQRNKNLQTAKEGRIVNMKDVVNKDSIVDNGYQGAVFYTTKKKPWDPDSKELVAIPVRARAIRENEMVNESVEAIIKDWTLSDPETDASKTDEQMINRLRQFVQVIDVKDAKEFNSKLETLPVGVTVFATDRHNGAKLFIGQGTMMPDGTATEGKSSFVKKKSDYDQSSANAEDDYNKGYASVMSIAGNVKMSFNVRKSDDFKSYSIDDNGNLIEKEAGSYADFLKKNMETKYRATPVVIDGKKQYVPSVSHVITFDLDTIKDNEAFNAAGAEAQREASDKIKSNPNIKRTINEDGVYVVENADGETKNMLRQSKLSPSLPIKDPTPGQRALSVGNVVDEVANNAFEGGSVKAAVNKANGKTKASGNKHTAKANEGVLESLTEQFKQVKTQLEDSGYEVHAKDTFLAAEFSDDGELREYLEKRGIIKEGEAIDGIAGALDLVAIKNGQIHIIDFKTSSDMVKFPSNLPKYAQQQKVYKILAEKNGYTVGSVNVMPISVTYDTQGTDVTITGAELVNFAEDANRGFVQRGARLSATTTFALDVDGVGGTKVLKSNITQKDPTKVLLDKMKYGLKDTDLEATSDSDGSIKETYDETDFDREMSNGMDIKKELDDYRIDPPASTDKYNLARKLYLEKKQKESVDDVENNPEEFMKQVIASVQASLMQQGYTFEADSDFDAVYDALVDFQKTNKADLRNKADKDGTPLYDKITDVIETLESFEDSEIEMQDALAHIQSTMKCG